MRYIVFLALLISGDIFSQDLTGTWKVISYEDEIAYFNKVTNFISYKDSTRKNKADSFRAMSEKLIFPIIYKFDNKNHFTLNHPIIGEIKGRYNIDESNKKIVFTDSDDKVDENSYYFNNEILFIEMSMEVGFIKIGLKKIN